MTASDLANGTIPLKSVLFATDFSIASMQALPYAKAIAQRFNAKLFSGHVVPPDDYPSGLNSIEEAAKLASREAELRMNDLLNSAHCHDLSCVGLVGTGDIWVGLSDFIRQYSIDLLVMGTVGRTGIRKFLLGSTAEEAMRESRCDLDDPADFLPQVALSRFEGGEGFPDLAKFRADAGGHHLGDAMSLHDHRSRNHSL